MDQDSEVMLAVNSGQPELFARIVAKHQSPLFRYALGRTGDRPLAEDLVQETFLAAFKGRATFDAKKHFCSWLWAIHLNVIRRHLGRRYVGTQSQSAALEVEPADLTHVPLIDRQDEEQRLRELLHRLPDEQAEAIRLKFFGGLSYEEIGQATGCKAATAKSRVRYALAKLNQFLKAETGRKL